MPEIGTRLADDGSVVVTVILSLADLGSLGLSPTPATVEEPTPPEPESAEATAQPFPEPEQPEGELPPGAVQPL